jgi:hypothetical protein
MALGAGLRFGGFGCGHPDERKQAPPAPPPTPAKPPQKMVIFFLSGGPDGVLTLDPKQSNEIAPWVDNPMADASVQEGDVRLGALWAPLKKWAPKMAVLHGVQVESANHFAGTWQFLRMRRRGTKNMPGLLDLIARHRQEPLGALTTGTLFNRTYTPNWLPIEGSVVPARTREGLEKFDQLSPEELREMSTVMHEIASDKSLRPADRAAYERVVAYVDALISKPKFVKADWGPSDSYDSAVTGSQRILWSFEHDLASAALVYFGFNSFDTHFANLNRQKNVNGAFVKAFDHFLQELHTRRNAHGLLADQTTIVVAGELGRYPRINSDQGKDHYPEISMLFMGAGVNAGAKGRVLGQTGKDMLGMPMDFKTGGVGGNRHVMLDDVGSTLLTLAGIEPTQYGYPSHPIEALLA